MNEVRVNLDSLIHNSRVIMYFEYFMNKADNLERYYWSRWYIDMREADEIADNDNRKALTTIKFNYDYR